MAHYFLLREGLWVGFVVVFFLKQWNRSLSLNVLNHYLCISDKFVSASLVLQ